MALAKGVSLSGYLEKKNRTSRAYAVQAQHPVSRNPYQEPEIGPVSKSPHTITTPKKSSFQNVSTFTPAKDMAKKIEMANNGFLTSSSPTTIAGRKSTKQRVAASLSYHTPDITGIEGLAKAVKNKDPLGIAFGALGVAGLVAPGVKPLGKALSKLQPTSIRPVKLPQDVPVSIKDEFYTGIVKGQTSRRPVSDTELDKAAQEIASERKYITTGADDPTFMATTWDRSVSPFMGPTAKAGSETTKESFWKWIVGRDETGNPRTYGIRDYTKFGMSDKGDDILDPQAVSRLKKATTRMQASSAAKTMLKFENEDPEAARLFRKDRMSDQMVDDIVNRMEAENDLGMFGGSKEKARTFYNLLAQKYNREKDTLYGRRVTLGHDDDPKFFTRLEAQTDRPIPDWAAGNYAEREVTERIAQNPGGYPRSDFLVEYEPGSGYREAIMPGAGERAGSAKDYFELLQNSLLADMDTFMWRNPDLPNYSGLPGQFRFSARTEDELTDLKDYLSNELIGSGGLNEIPNIPTEPPAWQTHLGVRGLHTGNIDDPILYNNEFIDSLGVGNPRWGTGVDSSAFAKWYDELFGWTQRVGQDLRYDPKKQYTNRMMKGDMGYFWSDYNRNMNESILFNERGTQALPTIDDSPAGLQKLLRYMFKKNLIPPNG